MYESDEYRALKAQVDHWERVKHHIDIARSFRRMKSGESITIMSKPRPGRPDPVVSVTLDGTHRNAAVEFLAECHVQAAIDLLHDPEWKGGPDALALRKACEV